MITFKCPKCGKTLQSPESEAGQTLDCPECQNVNRVPVPVKTGSSFPTWIVLVILAAIGIPVACGVLIVVCLVAITALGTSANATFGTVGNKIDGPGVKQKDKAIKPKGKPIQPIEKDEDD